MGSQKLRMLVIVAVMGICILAQPVWLVAQCVVTSTFVINYPGSTAVVKWFSSYNSCVVATSNNAQCKAGSSYMSYLSAIASTGVTSPYCVWTCECGSVRIDGSDGLPVELMDFSVE